MYQPQLQSAGAEGSGATGLLQPAPISWPQRQSLAKLWLAKLYPSTRLPGTHVSKARLGQWRQAAAGLALGTELSTDLGSGIFQRSWWLGAIACTALCGAAITIALDVPLLPEVARAPLTPSQREALSGQFIAPLAMGGRTGKTMVPVPGLVVPLAEIPERPRIEVSARLGGGRTLANTLKRAGVGSADIQAVEALLRPVFNPSKVESGTTLDLVLGRRETRSVPRPLDLLGFRAAFDLRLAINRVDGQLVLKKIPIKVDRTPLRINGLVAGGLERSLRAGGIPNQQAREFVKVMGYVIDMQRGIGKRDRYDIVLERDRAETGETRFGSVLYGAIDRQGKDLVEVGRYTLNGNADYFRANGESARKGLMRTPVDGARLTSGFGMRFHPLLAYSRMHQGVDFGARHGAPIYAAATGKVIFAAYHGGHGNYVKLQHSNGLATAYAHMSKFAVRNGQQVNQGQVIGYVGSTGVSTGPHLHYEVWLKGRVTNPLTLKFVGGTQLNGSDMNRFQSEMNRLRNTSLTGSNTPAPKRPTRRPT